MECTLYKTMNFIAKRWNLLIILELYKGDKEWKRYSEIKRQLNNITPKILSLRLKELQIEGLIQRREDTTHHPIKSEYKLTSSGNNFIQIIQQIKEWTLKNKLSNQTCKETDCKYCTISQ